MKRYDVMVIGARCAGSPLAMLLARAGLSVLVIEKAELPSEIINGHYIKPAGVARLASWGLLEQVLATGVPLIHRRSLAIGTNVTEREEPPGSPGRLAPRRFALDRVLFDAACQAGAEVRTGTMLRHLIHGGDRVVGGRLSDAGGHEYDALARVVVGADGRNSSVARHAGAALQRADGTTSIVYWGYWRGVRTGGAALSLGEGLAVGVAPTNDGLSVAFVQAATEAAQDFRSDARRHYSRVMLATPVIGALLGDAGVTLEGRVLGMLALPNYFRQAHGPGWALAGDAGHHKDPLVGRGISDAFRDAELLAEALLSGIGGTDEELSDRLESYAVARDDAVLRVYEANLALSRLNYPLEQVPSLFGALNRAEEVADSLYPPMAAFAVPQPDSIR